MTSLRVEGDLLKLQRIVQNLLINSLQATRRGGIVVRCSVERESAGQHWVLSIEDTGPGFPTQAPDDPKHPPNDTSGKTGAAARQDEDGVPKVPDLLPPGEGIGLAIVRRMCDALGATVEFQTAKALGTTFRITFPMCYSPQENEQG